MIFGIMKMGKIAKQNDLLMASVGSAFRGTYSYVHM